MNKQLLTVFIFLYTLSLSSVAQITSSEAKAKCKETLVAQNKLCENKPATGWRSKQNCLDRNQEFYLRCVENADKGVGGQAPRK